MPPGKLQGTCRGLPRPVPAALALPLCVWVASGCARPPPAAKAAQPSIVLGPWVVGPGPAQATVAWTTAEPVVGEVSFGTLALGRVAREGEARTGHRVVLQGLSPLTRYRYRIEAELPAEGAFTTAPDPSSSADQRFRVLISGDNRGDGGDHELVARAESAEEVQVALHTGDMVGNARSPELWARWFDAERDVLSRTALIPTAGNHEGTDRGFAYASHFLEKGMPAYHSVDYGPVHLLVLDSFEQAAGADPHEGAISEAQRAWAEADVKALKPERHLWVLVHQGPYSHPLRPRPGHGGSEAVRRVVAALHRVHPVEAVWAGHEHFYEHGLIDGMNFFVVGGGGAPLEDPDPGFPSVQAARKELSYAVVEVCGCHITGTAKNIFGTAIDSFTLSDCPQPCAARASSAAPAPKGPASPAQATLGPEAAKAIGADPLRPVSTDPARVVTPDPVRVVTPDPVRRAGPSEADEAQDRSSSRRRRRSHRRRPSLEAAR